METSGYAAETAGAPLKPFQFKRREVGDTDILIKIEWAGICHSDIHQVRDEWGGAIFPMVPGHEIVGRVTKVGSGVSKFKVGDIAGVGCMVDSCRKCEHCKEHEEQFCVKGCSFTYNGTEQDKKTPTYGGYSTQIVVDESFGVLVPASLESKLKEVAPLFCAGITVYSPLKRFEHLVKGGKKVGVVGLGGLGHMAVKIANAMGGDVTVFSTSSNKQADATSLGAKHFVISKDPEAMKAARSTLDLIIDTVAADHPLDDYVKLLKPHGALALVGAPPDPLKFDAFSLINGNRIVTGSSIGGIKETQEMIDFCAAHNLGSNVEVINIQDVDKAYERTIKSDVKYRFVIDISSLQQ